MANPTDDSTIDDGPSKGGLARAAKLTPDQRKAIAKKAAASRWGKESETAGAADDRIPRALRAGTLQIGGISIGCAVLPGGVRVLSLAQVARTLGGKRGGRDWQRQRDADVPVFLSASNLQPYITPSLVVALGSPNMYRPPNGGTIAHGVPATLLPEICDVWLKARDADPPVLLPSQWPLVERADLLMRGFARVGIIALVDEATGYQEERDRDELGRILAAYISQELLPWAKRFPDEFYEHLFRLRGWQYRPLTVRRPKYVGKLTSELIYEKLPDGVLNELRERNPTVDGVRRRHRHHQFLTAEIGNVHLERQLVAVTTLLRVSSTWAAFKRMFDRAFPGPGGIQQAMFEDEDSSDN